MARIDRVYGQSSGHCTSSNHSNLHFDKPFYEVREQSRRGIFRAERNQPNHALNMPQSNEAKFST